MESTVGGGVVGHGEPDDADVGRLFAAGDERALALAYERWAGLVHGIATRALGNTADAEDVTQQVFVSAWTGIGGTPPRTPGAARPAGWLVGITRHTDRGRCSPGAPREARARRGGPGRP